MRGEKSRAMSRSVSNELPRAAYKAANTPAPINLHELRATETQRHRGQRSNAHLAINPPTRRDDADADIGAGKMTTAIGIAGPAHASAKRQRQPSCTACQRMRSHQHAGGIAPFDNPLHTQPCRKRNPPQRNRRDVGEIEYDAAEAARLQHEVHRFQCAIDRSVLPAWSAPE